MHRLAVQSQLTLDAHFDLGTHGQKFLAELIIDHDVRAPTWFRHVGDNASRPGDVECRISCLIRHVGHGLMELALAQAESVISGTIYRLGK
jgi:hypothetical protein